MGLLRHRKDHPPTQRFRLREKLISIGDDYWIENDAGERVLKVNGKAARLRDTWVLEDAHGAEVAKIKEKVLTVRDSIEIEYGGGTAHVKKALLGIRDRFHVEATTGDLKAHGNVVDHEYKIERDGHTVAEVSKKWFRVRDTYGIEVQAGVDPVLVVAVTVAIDALSHD